ncbi:hypothetical protein O0L34_g4785 [Tuta absoluta]|nr:hypothetical protein O0L34_g4785 [Tuta absoluta]
MSESGDNNVIQTVAQVHGSSGVPIQVSIPSEDSIKQEEEKITKDEEISSLESEGSSDIMDFDETIHGDGQKSFKSKRTRESNNTTDSDDIINEEKWTDVGKGKKGKKERKIEETKTNKEDLEVYVTSKEPLPKQFAMASILKENGIKFVSRVKYINSFKIKIEFLSQQGVEQLSSCEAFIQKGWLVHKPLEANFCYGIIRNVDSELSDEFIQEKVSCFGQVLSAKRLKRRDRGDGSWHECDVVRLCFKGSSRPPHVFVDSLRIVVEPYVYPVSQCYKCWQIGHSIRNCPSKHYVCPKCTGKHENCETKVFCCVNCKGRHMSMNKTCPVYIKEKRVRELMAEFNCTYRKALTLYVKPSPVPQDRVEQPIRQNDFPVLNNTPIAPVHEHITPRPAYNSLFKESSLKTEVKNTQNIEQQQPEVRSYNKNVRKPSLNRGKKKNSQKGYGDADEIDWNIMDSDEDAHSEDDNNKEKTGKTSISELFYRLKEVIFLRSMSVQDKLGSIIRLTVEWVVIVASEFISSCPMFQTLFNLFNNGWN